MSRNTWRQNGDFSIYYGRFRPEGDARNIEFINPADNALIKRISFVGAVNGSFRFFIESGNNLDRTNIFRAEVRRLSLPYRDVIVRDNIERDYLRSYEHDIAYSSPAFRTIDDPIFLNVMTMIHNLEPSFESEMKEVVIGLINQYSNQQETQSRQGILDSVGGEQTTFMSVFDLAWRGSFFSPSTHRQPRMEHRLADTAVPHGEAVFSPSTHRQPRMQHRLADTAAPMTTQEFIDQTIFDVIPCPPVQMPAEGVNAKALSELGFDTTNIPKHFSCPLSGDIMDNPVIDPTTLNTGHTNINEVPRVERAWLERAISLGNGQSPFTRQPVVSPLIPDAQRKMDIENFVQEQRSRHSSAAFSKK